MKTTACRTVGQDRQECKETSSPLVDQQQKKGEHVENIKFSWVSKLNFMFSTCSPGFFVVHPLEGQTSEKSGNAI